MSVLTIQHSCFHAFLSGVTSSYNAAMRVHRSAPLPDAPMSVKAPKRKKVGRAPGALQRIDLPRGRARDNSLDPGGKNTRLRASVKVEASSHQILKISHNTSSSYNPQHRNNTTKNGKASPAKGEKEVGKCREDRAFSRYYALTQSCARTPVERFVATCTTASSSPERSRHRRTRSSPKFSLRWFAA